MNFELYSRKDTQDCEMDRVESPQQYMKVLFFCQKLCFKMAITVIRD